jgi:hypothetical protein
MNLTRCGPTIAPRGHVAHGFDAAPALYATAIAAVSYDAARPTPRAADA